jgi:hypothetical protein
VHCAGRTEGGIEWGGIAGDGGEGEVRRLEGVEVLNEEGLPGGLRHGEVVGS